MDVTTRKTVLITGGNSGLGYATALEFLRLGHRVIITCRTEVKAAEAKAKLSKESGSEQIESKTLGLTALANVARFVESLKEPIDILICNAGVAYQSLPVHYTAEGVEETFGVNHLSHFLLTLLLIKRFPQLEHVVVVSSSLHDPKASGGRFPAPSVDKFDLIVHPEQHGFYGTKKAIDTFYVNSKLCNIWFTYALEKRLRGTSGATKVNAFNPGFIPGTGLGRHGSAISRFMLRYIFPRLRFMFKFVRTAEQSAKAIAGIVQSQETGKYFDGTEIIRSSDLSYNEQKSEAMWAFSAELAKAYWKDADLA